MEFFKYLKHFDFLSTEAKLTFNSIANIGGLIKFISTIAFSLNYFVSQNCYYIKLINGFVFDGYYEIKNSGLKCQLVSKHESFLKNLKKKNETNHNSLNGKDNILKQQTQTEKKNKKLQ